MFWIYSTKTNNQYICTTCILINSLLITELNKETHFLKTLYVLWMNNKYRLKRNGGGKQLLVKRWNNKIIWLSLSYSVSEYICTENKFSFKIKMMVIQPIASANIWLLHLQLFVFVYICAVVLKLFTIFYLAEPARPTSNILNTINCFTTN